MQSDISSIIKNALTEYIKSHEESKGKIMEFINHMDDALKTVQSLPHDIQNELKQIFFQILVANGVLPAFLNK